MLTPEEKQTLIEFAGPMFALGKDIDSMYFNDQQTRTDGMRDGGISGAIKNALERDFRSSQVHQPQYIQPPPTFQPQMEVSHQQYIPQTPAVDTDPNQLEMKFDKSEQDLTNTLLRKQTKILEDLNKKIDKLFTLIQNESENNA
jgi:hypothetical protein